MNIFILDSDIQKNVQYLPDKHIIKMILESTQILSSSYYNLNIEKEISFPIYKKTHLKHPCCQWVLESKENFLWLQFYVFLLNEEYKYRFNHFHNHKSFEICKNFIVPNTLPNKNLTPFKKVVPLEFQKLETIKAYREYFKVYKNHIKKYSKRDFPEWWT